MGLDTKIWRPSYRIHILCRLLIRHWPSLARWAISPLTPLRTTEHLQPTFPFVRWPTMYGRLPRAARILRRVILIRSFRFVQAARLLLHFPHRRHLLRALTSQLTSRPTESRIARSYLSLDSLYISRVEI